MTDTKPTLETDKVLALARKAGLAVTISSHDSLHKFAALVEAVQQEHGGDITNPKCPICIAINALLLTTNKAEYRPYQ